MAFLNFIGNSNENGVLVTTDDTPTYLLSHDFQPGSHFQVIIRVMCRNPATGEMKSWYQIAHARRVGSNNVTLPGGVQTLAGPIGPAGLAAADISFQQTNGNGRIMVTGLAGVTLEWHGTFNGLGIQDSQPI